MPVVVAIARLAQVLLWNHNEQNFCKFETGCGTGNVRYNATHSILLRGFLTRLFSSVSSSRGNTKTGLLNEKVDVFSFCNNIYMLLTGQRVILDYYSDAAWQVRTNV
jgi:hypothetical protein